MAYEIYEKSFNRRTSPPTLTIGPSGRLGFNKAASERIKRDAYDYALLLWDAEAKKVAVRPIKKKDPRAFSLTPGKRGKGASIAAKSFCHFIGAKYTESRRFAARWSESEAAYEVWLDESDGRLAEEPQQRTQQRKRNSRPA